MESGCFTSQWRGVNGKSGTRGPPQARDLTEDDVTSGLVRAAVASAPSGTKNRVALLKWGPARRVFTTRRRTWTESPDHTMLQHATHNAVLFQAPRSIFACETLQSTYLRVIMDDETRSRYENKAKDLRTELKAWESEWAQAHGGSKPGRQDIKDNPDIGM